MGFVNRLQLIAAAAFLFLFIGNVSSQEMEELPKSSSSDWYLSVDPITLENIVEHIPHSINISLHYNGTGDVPGDGPFTVAVTMTNDKTVALSSSSFEFSLQDVIDGVGQNLIVTGQVIGYLHLNFLLENDESKLVLPPFLVTVVRFSDTWNSGFTIIITVLTMINFVSMGCGLDLAIVEKNILQPIGPLAGFFSQFTFMPLFSFVMAWLLLQDNLQCFGLLVMGVCPGGAVSNFWTLLLDGDVNLSITMTTVSTIAALVMMPFWLWLLAGFFVSESSMVKVPFLEIAMTLVFLTVPLGLGLLIRRFYPKIAQYVTDKIVKPLCFIVLIFSFGLGFYVLSYIFILLEWRHLVAGLLVVLAGFFFGAIVARMAKLNRAEIIAVSMETALQNGNIAFILLKVSLPTPYSDIAALPSIAQIIVCTAILYLLYAAMKIYAFFHKTEAVAPSDDDFKDTVDTVQSLVDSDQSDVIRMS